MRKIPPLLVVFAVAATLFAGSVQAEGSRYLRAERAAAKGRMLIRAGDVANGVSYLREAQRIAPDPRYILEEARALEEVLLLAKALVVFERYRDTGIEGRELTLVGAHITDLRMRLKSTHGEVMVKVDPMDAEVYLDRVAPDARIDTDRSLWVRAGDHALIVQQVGFVPTRLSFVVQPGASDQNVDVALSPVAEKATLIVRANRRDALVFVDGVERCKVPCERRLDPGTYLIRVEYAGDKPVQQLVRLTAGDTVPFDAMLEAGGTTVVVPEIITVQPGTPSLGVPGPGTVEPRPVGPVVAQPGDEQPVSTEPGLGEVGEPDIAGPDPFQLPGPAPQRSRLLGTMGWVTLGVGVAAAATGGVFNYLTFSKADEANGLDSGLSGYDRKFDDLKAETERNGLITTAMYAAGGALVVGGIAMIVIDAVKGDDSGHVTVISPGPAPGGGWMLQTETRF